MFDGILFDLDGTLWDALPEVVLTWSRVMEREGVELPGFSVEMLLPYMGMEVDDIARLLLPELEEQRRKDLARECCDAEVPYLARHGAALFPGEEAVLAQLSRRCPLFVVSNCQDGYIQAFYEGTGLGKYFTDMECAGRTGRPKRDNIALVVERHGLKRPVYVGDTALDCKAAQGAGVPFLHAAYGYGKVEGVPRVERFEDLPAALEALGAE